jgi:hypothetical protein
MTRLLMLFYRRIKHNIQSLWTILNLNTQGFERWYFILVALVATMAVKSYFSNIDPSANWVATGVVVLLVSALAYKLISLLLRPQQLPAEVNVFGERYMVFAADNREVRKDVEVLSSTETTPVTPRLRALLADSRQAVCYAFSGDGRQKQSPVGLVVWSATGAHEPSITIHHVYVEGSDTPLGLHRQIAFLVQFLGPIERLLSKAGPGLSRGVRLEFASDAPHAVEWAILLGAEKGVPGSSAWRRTLHMRDLLLHMQTENTILRRLLRISSEPPPEYRNDATSNVQLLERIRDLVERVATNFKNNTGRVKSWYWPTILLLLGVFSWRYFEKASIEASPAETALGLALIGLVLGCIGVIVLWRAPTSGALQGFKEHYFSKRIEDQATLTKVNAMIERVFQNDALNHDGVDRIFERCGLQSIVLYAATDESKPLMLVGCASCWPVAERVYKGMRDGSVQEDQILPDDVFSDRTLINADYLYVPVVVVEKFGSSVGGRRAVALMIEFLAFIRRTYVTPNGRERTLFLIGHSDQGADWANRLGMGEPVAYPQHFGKQDPFFERRLSKESELDLLRLENELLRDYAGLEARRSTRRG